MLWSEQIGVALEEGPTVHLVTLLARLTLALAMGGAVAWLYQKTRNGTGAPSLPATLVLLAVLIAAVTQVIGDNIARAFSLVGALSIVRFRTVVRDTRDTAFVIFAVVAGMGIGAGHTKVSAATLAIGGLAAWIMRSGRALPQVAREFELTLRAGLGHDTDAIASEVFPQFFRTWQGGAVVTARQGAALEVTWIVALKPEISPAAVVRALNRREDVQNVELRLREDGN
jgi:hypothetical protein